MVPRREIVSGCQDKVDREPLADVVPTAVRDRRDVDGRSVV